MPRAGFTKGSHCAGASPSPSPQRPPVLSPRRLVACRSRARAGAPVARLGRHRRLGLADRPRGFRRRGAVLRRPRGPSRVLRRGARLARPVRPAARGPRRCSRPTRTVPAPRTACSPPRRRGLRAPGVAWARRSPPSAPPDADALHLHHLTPIHEAASRVAPDVPVIGHLHGTELLMLEEIRAVRRRAGRTPPLGRADAPLGAQVRPAHRAVAIADPARRAAARPRPGPAGRAPQRVRPALSSSAATSIARRCREALVEAPRGWRAGQHAGSVRYRAEDLAPLVDGVVVLTVSRFTAVKRLPLLIEAFAQARDRAQTPAGLVIVGGHPGEWEGEHPADTIARLGVRGVFLAGWHDHAEVSAFLSAADVFALASVREQFGLVLVEAMACECRCRRRPLRPWRDRRRRRDRLARGARRRRRPRRRAAPGDRRPRRAGAPRRSRARCRGGALWLAEARRLRHMRRFTGHRYAVPNRITGPIHAGIRAFSLPPSGQQARTSCREQEYLDRPLQAFDLVTAAFLEAEVTALSKSRA